MYAQVTTFDGPRSPELVAASDVANRDRIKPALRRDAQLQQSLALNLVLRRPDGAEMVVTVTQDAEALRRGGELIMATELLPGEDPMLLPGPSRIEDWSVVDAFTGDAVGALLDRFAGASNAH